MKGTDSNIFAQIDKKRNKTDEVRFFTHKWSESTLLSMVYCCIFSCRQEVALKKKDQLVKN